MEEKKTLGRDSKRATQSLLYQPSRSSAEGGRTEHGGEEEREREISEKRHREKTS